MGVWEPPGGEQRKESLGGLAEAQGTVAPPNSLASYSVSIAITCAPVWKHHSSRCLGYNREQKSKDNAPRDFQFSGWRQIINNKVIDIILYIKSGKCYGEKKDKKHLAG